MPRFFLSNVRIIPDPGAKTVLMFLRKMSMTTSVGRLLVLFTLVLVTAAQQPPRPNYPPPRINHAPPESSQAELSPPESSQAELSSSSAFIKNATELSSETLSDDGPPEPWAAVFADGFVESLLMILVSELGDKTFFIAAILAMRHSRHVIFAGAISALALMTVLSAAFGYLLPTLLPKAYTHWASGTHTQNTHTHTHTHTKTNTHRMEGTVHLYIRGEASALQASRLLTKGEVKSKSF